MSRRYEDDVHVRLDARDGGTAAPAAFVWRDRLYVVREVLGHWHERTAWWEEPERRPTASVADREVWRVAAAAGRAAAAAGTGTYDLGRVASPDGPDERAWRLLEVVD